MQGKNPILDGGRELSYMSLKDVYYGNLLARVIRAINTMAKNASVSPKGKLPAPPPIDGITVQGGTVSNGIMTVPNSEILHWTMTHNAPIQKGVQYISEIDTSPNFTQPHVIDHGCSRSGFISLPTMNGANTATNTYYLRSYAQYHGSDPSKPTVLGGLSGAIGIQMGGSSQMDLLPSNGSGTAQPNGQQGGKGLGTVLNRPAPQAKRSLTT